MASTLELLRRLSAEKVDFVLVGGMAAIAHGSATVTEDVDLCIRFDLPTLTAVLRALAGTNPRERMNPLTPKVIDPARWVGYRNLYLVTDEGVIDLLSETLEVGRYDAVAANAVEMDLGGFSCRVIGLEDLIRCKRALGRPKDLNAAAQLDLVKKRTQRFAWAGTKIDWRVCR
jgi:predicted nucleotidyltransferase